MINWRESMIQEFEYYIVDPSSWQDVKAINVIKNAALKRDNTTETLGSATFEVTQNLGECYVRAYMTVRQNGEVHREPLGTYLVQSPSDEYNGFVTEMQVEAYTPLIELKDNKPPIGYSIFEGTNIMDAACILLRDHLRAPVVELHTSDALKFDFVADTEDTWLSFLTDLIGNAGYQFGLDEYGRVLFAPIENNSNLTPKVTYNTIDGSIMYPEVEIAHDYYSVPNIVEVVYSNGSTGYYGLAVNDDPNSPTSRQSRGRDITLRITDPGLAGNSSAQQIQDYAEQQLKTQSTLQYEVTYSHGYYPVTIGDGIEILDAVPGYGNIRATIVSQGIKCEPGCPVTEKAVFTKKLWR